MLRGREWASTPAVQRRIARSKSCRADGRFSRYQENRSECIPYRARIRWLPLGRCHSCARQLISPAPRRRSAYVSPAPQHTASGARQERGAEAGGEGGAVSSVTPRSVPASLAAKPDCEWYCVWLAVKRENRRQHAEKHPPSARLTFAA